MESQAGESRAYYGIKRQPRENAVPTSADDLFSILNHLKQDNFTVESDVSLEVQKRIEKREKILKELAELANEAKKAEREAMIIQRLEADEQRLTDVQRVFQDYVTRQKQKTKTYPVYSPSLSDWAGESDEDIGGESNGW